MLNLKFHRVPHSKLPKMVFNYCTLVRLISIKHLTSFNHKSLKLFQEKGVKCANPKCERRGHYIAISVDPNGALMVNVITKDMQLMTKDHIVPTSKGGPNIMSNWQPMCYECNCVKGDTNTPSLAQQIVRFEERREKHLKITPVKNRP